MLKKKKVVNYLTKDVPQSLNENLELLRHASVYIESAFTKRYYNSIVLLMQLSRAERIFLDFLTEEMDENNRVTNSAQLRNKFNALLQRTGQEIYTDGTLHRCFNGLVKNHLLYKEKGRGLYQVSALFFFKGSEEQRIKLVRERLERLNKEPINKARHGYFIQREAEKDPDHEA